MGSARGGGEVGVDEARGLNDVGGDSTHVEDNLSRLGLIDADADELGGEAFGDEANGAIVGLEVFIERRDVLRNGITPPRTGPLVFDILQLC